MASMTAEAEINPPPNVLLAGINGSTAYGLATEDSDIDRIGTFAAPTSRFHGLHPPTSQDKTWVSTKPDCTYHEAGKLAGLMLACNPHALELTWLGSHEVTTPEGEALVGIRSAFLSAGAVRGSYLDYAAQQYKRIRNRGDGAFSSDTRKRTEKHARHIWRLLCQGTLLHLTGQLPVMLDEYQVAACRAFGARVAGGDLEGARVAIKVAEEAFDKPGVLPGRPDESAAESWLQRVRYVYWDRP
jgi:uncharacterized protein